MNRTNDNPWDDLFRGHRELLVHPCHNAGDRNRPSLVFPGAFNPLHDGHRRMAELAAQIHGARVDWEISIENVDKPPLDMADIETRIRQFSDEATICLTRAPTFVQKARLFPEATFIVGADTLARIVAPEYYQDRAQGIRAAVATIRSQGCRFLVFGRIDQGTQFQTLESLSLPSDLRCLCQEVPETDFREDISSSTIRSTSKRA